MLGDQHTMDYLALCPLCGNKTEGKPFFIFKDLPQKCDDCRETLYMIRCTIIRCKFQKVVCPSCYVPQRQRRSEVKSRSSNKYDEPENSPHTVWVLIVVGVVLLPFIAFLISRSWKEVERPDEKLLKELREGFPSQMNETWYHFLSVLEKSVPSVKSITFLHSEDKRTPDCLINKLVSLYSEDETLKMEEITFSAAGFEAKEYGFALQHYHSVVEKFRVFVTDLTTVSGEIARIFHSLCDEVSSDIKPSLFIFTLKYGNISQNQKPLERATTILKENWSDLPLNEISPLLSRVLKNVVHIVPEKESSC